MYTLENVEQLIAQLQQGETAQALQGLRTMQSELAASEAAYWQHVEEMEAIYGSQREDAALVW